MQLAMAINTALVAGITFISATATTFIVLEIFYFANKKRQEHIEKELDKDE